MNVPLHIGCCGFPVARAGYFGAFRVVEVQQTFYQPPENALAEKWRRESPGDFEYTLKAWQLITHEPKSPTYKKLTIKVPASMERRYGSFKPTDEVFAAWERTREIAEILRAKVIVFQCPASFRPTAENRRNLAAFFSTIDRQDFILGWEPRGEWSGEEIRKICEGQDLVHVVDPFMTAPVHGTIGYFRLHGIGGYRYRYSDDDLAKLRETAERTAAEKSGAYIMFNNVHMFEDALRFKSMVG